jgi:hypothetical protein
LYARRLPHREESNGEIGLTDEGGGITITVESAVIGGEIVYERD